jgi:hypothetical protein
LNIRKSTVVHLPGATAARASLTAANMPGSRLPSSLHDPCHVEIAGGCPVLSDIQS